MDQSSGNKAYNAKDIERYHAGKMSAREMHALEKAAMNDPFLADALEGYTYTTTPQSDLEQIKKRLAEKSQKKKVVPLFSKTWTRVAAVILVLGVGGWLLTSRMQDKNQNIASSPAEKILRTTDTTDIVKDADQFKVADSASNYTMPGKEIIITPEKDIVASSGGNRKPSHQQLSAPGLESKENGIVEFKDENKKADSARREDVILRSAAPGANKKDAALQPSRSEVEQFYRDSGSSDRTVLADKSSSEKKEASGKIAGVKVNDTLKNLDVTMKPIPGSVSEVVVSASTQNKKAKQYTYTNVVVDTLEPTGGWVKYDDYVANNIRVPDEIRQKEVSGVVQLSFDVDKNGDATNIKVVKSLCESCDQEAIRLLKEGPKWKKKKNKKGKLTVRF